MKIHVYQDLRGEWRWRLVAANGRVVADGSEGYSTKENLSRAVDTLLNAFHEGVDVVGEDVVGGEE